GVVRAVGEVVAVAADDRIRLRPELANEGAGIVGTGTSAPAAEAVFPPAEEEIEPHLVVNERDLDLHLLAAGDAAVKGPGIVEDAVDEAMVLVGHRPGEFAADQ